LMIFEQFIFRYVTSLPPTISTAEYGVYGLQALAVILTFVCVVPPTGETWRTSLSTYTPEPFRPL